jgi:hypothetical protein
MKHKRKFDHRKHCPDDCMAKYLNQTTNICRKCTNFSHYLPSKGISKEDRGDHRDEPKKTAE